MNAIHLLKQQHDDVKDLFDKFEKADTTTEKDSICQKLANNLVAHMTIEERIFYPAAFSALNDEGQLAESLADHRQVKQLLARILDDDMSRDMQHFEDNMRRLKLSLAEHIAEEEQKVFKEAKRVMSQDQLVRLGEQMKDLFEQEMAGEPCELLSDRLDDDRFDDDRFDDDRDTELDDDDIDFDEPSKTIPL